MTFNADGSINQTSASLIDVSGTGAGGSIVISAGPNSGSNLYSSATYNANGANGGSIEILGDSLALMAATLDASGANGGGAVLIGGAAHGGGGLQQASDTLVNPYTTINVDATTSGNGGTAVVWSNQETDYYGTISARGGANGGNGGYMEVSSGDSLTFGGFADASAPYGTAGSLLLDPRNITISTGVAAPEPGSTSPTPIPAPAMARAIPSPSCPTTTSSSPTRTPRYPARPMPGPSTSSTARPAR